MVKLVEFFHNSDLPEKILPPIDFDVAEDLVVFMRNDPVFYRKSLFPAIETVKSTDPMDTTALQNVVAQGLGKYCEKFHIPHPKTELLTDADISSIVERLVAEEIKGEGDLNEGVMHMLRRWFTGDPQAKSWLEKYNIDPKAAEKMVGSEVRQKYLNRYIGIQKAAA